jgi:hypothetical protein
MRSTVDDSNGISHRFGLVCVCGEVTKRVGAWWQGNCADRKLSLCRPACHLRFPTILLVRASHMERDTRFELSLTSCRTTPMSLCDSLPLRYANGEMNGDEVATSPPASRQQGIS